VLPLSIVGGVGLKISARIGYSQIWLHKIQLGQSWLQAPLQEGVDDQLPTVDCGSTVFVLMRDGVFDRDHLGDYFIAGLEARRGNSIFVNAFLATHNHLIDYRSPSNGLP
jgi:hypothetical protein